MFDKNNALAIKIKNTILSNFLYADIEISFDKEQNEYYISTRNKELYYSEAYGMLVFDIEQNILWKQGIFNFYFILEEGHNKYKKMADVMSVAREESGSYSVWNTYSTGNLTFDNNIELSNFYLAA